MLMAAGTQSGLRRRHGSDRVLFLEHDVTSERSWKDVIEKTVATFGGLDILVNNAGTGIAGGFDQLTLEQLRASMSVNFESQFIGIQQSVAALASRAPKWRGGAAVINNSSTSAYNPASTSIAYSSAKAASRMLTMCAAKGLGSRGIRVNSIHIGVTPTTMVRGAFDHWVDEGLFPNADAAMIAMKAKSAIGKLGTIANVGALVTFLASDDAEFITGAGFIADGGMDCHY